MRAIQIALFPLPEGSTGQFSMLGSNPPTAGLILSEYTDLEPGDWIVQNAANSGVGRSLIALAKARGFRTINLARDESVLAGLTASGADVVHLDDATAVEDVQEEIGDARVALAVDSVGGVSAARLLDLLSEGGSLVAYATATGQPMPVDELTLIVKRATVRGFFAGHYDYATKVLPVRGNGWPPATTPPGLWPGQGAALPRCRRSSRSPRRHRVTGRLSPGTPSGVRPLSPSSPGRQRAAWPSTGLSPCWKARARRSPARSRALTSTC